MLIVGGGLALLAITVYLVWSAVGRRRGPGRERIAQRERETYEN